MSDHPAEGTVQPELRLTDDDFSPTRADDDRQRIPRVAAEREALAAYLEYYRATVEMKCRDLTREQARTRTMPPSDLSLHGLVRHLAGVERWWFQQNFERRDVPFLFSPQTTPTSTSTRPRTPTSPPTWRTGARSVRFPVRSSPLTTSTTPRVRWIGTRTSICVWLVLRMITEYAQHCGHVDLLREGVDGRTGA